jgi:ABC-type Na+ efflux pump permease subunit
MIKSLTVAKYEFSKNIKRKEFFLMTFLFPLVTIMLITAPAMLMSSSYNGNKSVGYIDQANLFGETSKTKEELQFMGSFEGKAYTIQFVKY